MTNTYWDAVDAALKKLATATTADQVVSILDTQVDLPEHSAPAFFGGDGDDMLGALYEAGWRPVDVRASYHWCMRAPDGSLLTYVEGDVYLGNSMPEAS